MASAQTQCLPVHRVLKPEPADRPCQWDHVCPELTCSTPQSRAHHSLRLIDAESDHPGSLDRSECRADASDPRSSPRSFSLRQTRLNFSTALCRDDESTIAMLGDLEFNFEVRSECDAKTAPEPSDTVYGNLETEPHQQVDKQSESVLSRSILTSPRATKQAILTTDLSLSDRPVTKELPKRAKKPSDKRPVKGSRNRSLEPRPTPTQPAGRPRAPRSKAVSASPKKAVPSAGVAQLITDSNDVAAADQKPKRQTQLTTYGIRRTARQFQKDQEREREANILTFLREKVESGMKVILTEEKGRGVVATRVFHEGEFVVEYAGELIPEKLAKEREAEYKKNPEIGSYMFFFVHGGQKYCVDATKETPRLGRLINHSRLHPNCHVKVIPLDGIPRLVLFARQTINPGEELLYDYGDRDKESLEAHPWLRM